MEPLQALFHIRTLLCNCSCHTTFYVRRGLRTNEVEFTQRAKTKKQNCWQLAKHIRPQSDPSSGHVIEKNTWKMSQPVKPSTHSKRTTITLRWDSILLLLNKFSLAWMPFNLLNKYFGYYNTHRWFFFWGVSNYILANTTSHLTLALSHKSNRHKICSRFYFLKEIVCSVEYEVCCSNFCVKCFDRELLYFFFFWWNILIAS